MTKRFFFQIPALILIIVLASCSSEEEQIKAVTYNNPFIKTGSFFPNSNWNDPHVIHDGTRFIMYASADVNFSGNIKIYRLVSADGISWQLEPFYPVFDKSSSGWDSKSVETPAVVLFKGKYHLFYTGYQTWYGDSGNFKIGHAESEDGITWIRKGVVIQPTDPHDMSDLDNPLWKDPNLDFNQYITAEPAPVVFNDKIYLYFTAVGANTNVNTTLQVIGLTTYNGSTWTQAESVLEPDQTIYPRSTYIGYSTPNAIVTSGKIHLFFDIVKAEPWQQVMIHRAVSADGKSGWLHDSAPLLAKENYSWTEAEIRSPSALVHENKLYLYFAGHRALDLAIGLEIYDLF